MNIVDQDQPLAETPANSDDLAEGAVPPIEKQGIALGLKLGREVARMLGERGVGRHLGLETTGVVAQHVHDEQVGQSVAVGVSHIEPHARVAHLALRGPVGQPELAATVVQPEPVGVFEIIGDIEIGSAVSSSGRQTSHRDRTTRPPRRAGSPAASVKRPEVSGSRVNRPPSLR